VCFLVGDLTAHKPGYGSVHLAFAALRRGHDVRFVSINDLSVMDDNTVLAPTVGAAAASYETTEDYLQALLAPDAPLETESLSAFDVIFLRYNPMLAPEGPRAPVIDFCWRLTLGGTLVVNDPEGLRRAGGRMYLADLPPEVQPRTVVSRSPRRIKEFVRRLDGPAVLKPLSPHGVDAVFYVRRRQVANLNQIIAKVTEAGHAVAQEYLPEAEQGEKRVLLVGGEPLRVDDKVVIYQLPARRVAKDGPPGPARGGAVVDEDERRLCDFGPVEERLCTLLRPKLLADGLYFVSVDFLGDKIVRLEVFVPGGMHSAKRLHGIDVADVIIADLERRVRLRRAYRTTFDPEAARIV
jgi:glutathione synthase